MRDRHVLDRERPDRDALPGGDLPELDLGRSRLAEPARLEDAEREARRIDRHPQPRPQLGQGADMVLMGVGDEDREEVLALALDEAGIREHQVDARQPLLARKAEADNRRGSTCATARGPKP